MPRTHTPHGTWEWGRTFDMPWLVDGCVPGLCACMPCPCRLTRKSVVLFACRTFIQFWALGYSPTHPSAKPPPFYLSPDGLWGVVELLWCGLVLFNMSKYQREAARGNRFAATSQLLPSFRPLVKAMIPGLLLFILIVAASEAWLDEVDSSGTSGVFMVREVACRFQSVPSSLS